jgi:hypothetical protein
VSAFSPGPFLRLSSHVSGRFAAPRDPVKAALRLRALLSKRYFDWVIVADDDLLHALLENGSRNELVPWLPFDPLDEATVALLTSKHAFAAQAPGHGIPVPESVLARSLSELLGAATLLGYPLVLKGDRGFSGAEVDIVSDEAALRRRAGRHFERYGAVLVQRYAGTASAAASVLYHRGRPSAYSAYRTLCGYPNATSASTVHETFEHPALDGIVRAVGRATGFHGLLGIDFIHDAASGALYALEINPRPTIGFSGTLANRQFFSPFVAEFLADRAGPGTVYAGAERVRVYFPTFLCYLATRRGAPDPQNQQRLGLCLREARHADWRLAAWELVRFVRDLVVKRVRLGRRSIQPSVPPAFLQPNQPAPRGLLP